MTEAVRQYELGPAEFQRAMAVLEQEQRSIGLSRAQRVAYRIYTVSFAVFVASLVGLVIYLLCVPGEAIGSVTLVLLLTGSVSFLGALLCIPLNFSLMMKIWRQKNNFRRLGFFSASEILWKAQSRRRRWARLAAKGAFAIGVLMFVGGLVQWCLSRDFPGIFWFALPLVVFSFLQEGKAWLDMVASRLTEITQLQASLLGLQKGAEANGAERISVPTETIQKIARIDRERIVRGRADAIAEAAKMKWTEFSVLTSREVFDSKANLDAETRIRVEETIEKLMQQPTSDGYREDPETGLLHLPIEGTDREIVYRVDVPEQRVSLVALRPTSIAGGQHA